MPDPTERDRELRKEALSPTYTHLLDCSGKGWPVLTSGVDKAIASAREEGRRAGIQGALDALDQAPLPRVSFYEATKIIARLLEPPDGEGSAECTNRK